jgi:hypothetical protein
MITAQIRTKIPTGWRPAYYALRLRRLIDSSVLWGNRFTETGCAVWVCPDCGYTELAATNPAALLEP